MNTRAPICCHAIISFHIVVASFLLYFVYNFLGFFSKLPLFFNLLLLILSVECFVFFFSYTMLLTFIFLYFTLIVFMKFSIKYYNRAVRCFIKLQLNRELCFGYLSIESYKKSFIYFVEYSWNVLPDDEKSFSFFIK